MRDSTSSSGATPLTRHRLEVLPNSPWDILWAGLWSPHPGAPPSVSLCSQRITGHSCRPRCHGPGRRGQNLCPFPWVQLRAPAWPVWPPRSPHPHPPRAEGGYHPELPVVQRPGTDIVVKHVSHLVETLVCDGHPSSRQLLLAQAGGRGRSGLGSRAARPWPQRLQAPRLLNGSVELLDLVP